MRNRTGDGKPDLSGIWLAESAPREELIGVFGPSGINGLGEFSAFGHPHE